MHDTDLRDEAILHLRDRFPAALRRGEMGLLNHTVRADLALLDDELMLVELKSEADTLRRLPEQVRVYSEVADRCLLVVAENHHTAAVKLIPEWWAVWVASPLEAGFIGMHFTRLGEKNPTPCAESIARMLWDEELREAMRTRGMKPGKLRQKEKAKALADRLPLAELRAVVRNALRTRRIGHGGFAPMFGEVRP